MRVPSPTTPPADIVILMATRARPAILAEVFTSLQTHTTQKDRVEFWIYVDDDDTVMKDAIAANSLPDPGIPVHWHIGPQTGGLGETHQTLWKLSGQAAPVYMITVDDARFDTAGWDDIIRQEFAKCPDGVLLAFPHDPMTADAATYPIFGRWIGISNAPFQ